MSTRRFNSERLRLRRQDVGHSTLSLARQLATSPATIREIERGVNPKHYEIGLLERYAQALGIGFDQLFDDTGDSPTGRQEEIDHDDVAAVIALVHSTNETVDIDLLAHALNWPPARVRLTLDDAAQRLRGVGLRIVWHGDIAVTLAADLTTRHHTATLNQRRIPSSGLRHNEAQRFSQFIAHRTRARCEDKSVERALLDANLVARRTTTNQTRADHGVADALEITDEALYNLCLRDCPPHRGDDEQPSPAPDPE